MAMIFSVLPKRFSTIAPIFQPLHFTQYKFLHLQNKLLKENNSYSDFDLETYYTCLLKNITHKKHLQQIHARLLVSGIQYNGFIITKFLNVSSDLGLIHYAQEVFDEFPDPYVFLWNAVIRGYSMQNMFNEAIKMYLRMHEFGVRPDGFTIPHVLKACGGLQSAGIGRAVHGHIYRLGFEWDVFVQNGLVSLYAKCGRIDFARVVFDRVDDRTVVSWTSIISGYAQNGKPWEALGIFREMRRVSQELDWVTLVSVLSAYTDVNDLLQGKAVHGCIVKMGLEFECDLRIALTTLYAKCGELVVAKSLFDQMEVSNVMLWNAMISGYAKNGCADDAIQLFWDMIKRNIRPDSITIRLAILACAHAGSLERARCMDEFIINSDYRHDIYVNTALIDMYAKCGSVELARRVFDKIINKDVVAWSAMIVSYGLHGQGCQSIDLFHDMIQAGVIPNDVTFIGVLTACNHSGLVEEGWYIFHRMKHYGIEPRYQHYACVVDLLGRAGYLEQAYHFIRKMPIEPHVSVWGALLGACKIHRHVTLGEYAAEQLFSLDPYNTGHYVQLSNLYASVRFWSGVAKVRVMMKERGLSKDLGYSLI